MTTLRGQVAVVAGATRGAGRGIARALGEAGATVYCTGRSVKGQPSPYNRPETIEESAELVTKAGGKGIAARVDHTSEDAVRALFERVKKEQKRLDILVNSMGGEDPLLGGWNAFWETDMARGADVLRNSVYSHVLTARHAAPLMVAKKRGLIVEVTEGDFLGGSGNILHDLVKSSGKMLAFRMSEELRPHGVTAMAITPGFLRSEAMLEHFKVTEATWRDGVKQDKHFAHSETPWFIGRAVAAVAGDAMPMRHSGDLTSSWELSREYGFTDFDGSRPDWGGHWPEVMVEMPFLADGLRRQAAWLDRVSTRAKGYADGQMKKGRATKRRDASIQEKPAPLGG